MRLKDSQVLKNLEKDRWNIYNKEKQDKEANLGEQKGPGAKGNLRLEEGHGNDPVHPYFQEVGRFSLLTREEEIQIAKRIEISQKKVALKQDLKKVLHAREEIEAAKKEFVEANQRLVISIAKKYINRGVQFLDLIQEGNIGLMKAVDKFDYRRGYKFGTYATWWIRQGITRAIQDQARTIRLPVHIGEVLNKVIRSSGDLAKEIGRSPTPDEIARKMELPIEKVKKALEIARRRNAISLETPMGEEHSHLGDFIADKGSVSPEEAAIQKDRAERVQVILATLTPREEKVLRRRFGIGEETGHTLQEVGDEFGVTRERIRQIQAKALTKLRHSSRSKRLAFMEE